MRFACCLLLLSLIAFSGNAQKKWHYELYYSIDELSGDDFLNASENFGAHIFYSELNYTVGINIQRELESNLYILSGMLYSNQAISKTFICNTCSDVVFDIIPFGSVEPQGYFQIPLGLGYTYQLGKLQPMVDFGLLNNLLVSSATDDIAGNESPKGFYLATFLGTKLHYQAFDRLGFNLGYRHSTSLTNVFESGVKFTSNNLLFGITYTPRTN